MQKIKLTLILTLVLGCQTNNTKDATVKKDIEVVTIPAVTIAIINESNFNRQIVSNGKIEAHQKSELRFNNGEKIIKVNVKNGQRVSKGQLLAYQEDILLDNEVQKAQTDVDKALSKFEEEKINYGFDDTSGQTISSEVLQNIKFKSGVQEAENALANAQLRLEQTYLRAPFSGVVANIETKEGDYITSSDPFCTLINQNKLEVSFSVLEGDFSFVEQGQSVIITPFSDVDKTYTGTVSEINPLVDENGLVTVKATINDRQDRLFDGMNTKVYINKPRENVIVIPKEALVLRSNREVVFTLEEGLAKWNYVEVVDENSTHYALKKESVQVGDTIIVSGNANLSHDAKVKATTVFENQ